MVVFSGIRSIHRQQFIFGQFIANQFHRLSFQLNIIILKLLFYNYYLLLMAIMSFLIFQNLIQINLEIKLILNIG